MLEIMWKL